MCVKKYMIEKNGKKRRKEEEKKGDKRTETTMIFSQYNPKKRPVYKNKNVNNKRRANES